MSTGVTWDDKAATEQIDKIIEKKLTALTHKYMRILDGLFRAPKHGRIYGAEQSVSWFVASDGGGSRFGKKVSFTANKGKMLGGKGKRGSGVHQASAPDEAPAIDTGALRKSVTYEVSREGGEVSVSIGVSAQGGRSRIAEWLEFGTKMIAPRPAWRPALEKLKDEAPATFGEES